MNSHLLRKFTCIYMIWLSMWGVSNAQNPGGVSIKPMIWLKADAGVISTNTISSWTNQSNDSIHTAQAISDNQPSISANAMNFNPAISLMEKVILWQWNA